MSSPNERYDEVLNDEGFDIAEQANSPDDTVPGIIDAPKPQPKAEVALKESAATPWYIDLFAAISLAGVVVFNAANMPIWIRIVALIALLASLLLETRYSAGAQARSDRYLMMTLGGIVGGFILIIVASIVILETVQYAYIEWVLFIVISLMAFVVTRGFRYATRAVVEKANTDKELA